MTDVDLPFTGTVLQPGTQFAGLRVEECIGRGGMGLVYRALQPELGRLVALKVIAPELTQDPIIRERFKAEARLAASVEHPNIVPIHHAGEVNGALYLVMRLIRGPSLQALLRQHGLFKFTLITRIVSQLASALDVAHESGLVHRDVKPANVLVSRPSSSETVYLTDFGLAKTLQSTMGFTRSGQWVGTPDYVAPEQIRGDPVDGRADVYALGCVLYELLTGEVPYPRDNEIAKLFAHVNSPPPTPSLARGSLVRAFDEVVHVATAKNPDERFQSAGELSRAAENAGVRAAAGSGAPDSKQLRTGLVGSVPTEVASPLPTLTPPHTARRSAVERHGTPVATATQVASETASRDPSRLAPERPEARRRRSMGKLRPALVAAAIVIAGTSAAVLGLTGGSGVPPARVAARTRVTVARAGEVAVAYPAAWHLEPHVPPAEAGLFSKQIVLVSLSTTLSAGQLVSPPVIPGGLPSLLRSRLGSPTAQSAAFLGRYPAKRYEWHRSGSSSTVAFVLTSKPADVAIICYGRTTTSCGAVAGTLTIHDATIHLTGDNAAVNSALTADLSLVSKLRRSLKGLSLRRLVEVTQPARQIAAAETAAASKLKVKLDLPRNVPGIARIVGSLEAEANVWRTVAGAAASNQRVEYMKEASRVASASTRLSRAAGALKAAGFRIPLLATVSLPPVAPPTRPHQPARRSKTRQHPASTSSTSTATSSTHAPPATTLQPSTTTPAPTVTHQPTPTTGHHAKSTQPGLVPTGTLS